MRECLSKKEADIVSELERRLEGLRKRIKDGKTSRALSSEDETAIRQTAAVLKEQIRMLHEKTPEDGIAAFELIKADFGQRTAALKKRQKRQVNVFPMYSLFARKYFRMGRRF